MTREKLLKLNEFDVFVPIFVVLGVIIIFSSGYQAGQWLYEILH